jgi:hypothetical protein
MGHGDAGAAAGSTPMDIIEYAAEEEQDDCAALAALFRQNW